MTAKTQTALRLALQAERLVLALRERHRARLPLVLMNSAATRGPSLAALRRYDGLRVPGVPPDFLQGREPKIRAGDWLPVQWPADPELEWCPPGHGDIYTALAASGTLDALLRAGLRYAFVSNSDNLGALADARITAWLAAEQAPVLFPCGSSVRWRAGHSGGGYAASATRSCAWQGQPGPTGGAQTWVTVS